MNKEKKYLFNVGTGTLHIMDGCYYSTNINLQDENYKTYTNEDDAIKENLKYMKRCKTCFKNH